MIKIIVLILIVVVGFGYALMPQVFLLGVDDREVQTATDEVQNLREEKEKWMQGLRDLETEREVGNISEPEYRKLREQYKGNAARVLQKLKSIESVDSDPAVDKNMDDILEEEIQKKKDEISS